MFKFIDGKISRANPKNGFRPQVLGRGDYDYTELGQAKVLLDWAGDEFIYNEKNGLLWFDGVRFVPGSAAVRLLIAELTDQQEKDYRRQWVQAEQDHVKKVGEIMDDPELKQEDRDKKRNEVDDELKREKDQLNDYIKFVSRMRNNARISAVASLFCDLVKPYTIPELDADPMLLNTPSYTYNLETGERREHDPADLITKVTSCDPSDDEYEKQIWNRFLFQVQATHLENILALQVIAGAALIGKVYDPKLIIAVGEGGNGKSTLFDTWIKVLSGQRGDNSEEAGAYASMVNSSLLVKDPHRGDDSSKKFSLSTLRGLRLAVAGELGSGSVLTDGIMKKITSIDPITYEIKFKQGSPSFTPTHTMILFTNYLPHVTASDDGTWDRFLIIPFEERFRGSADENKDLPYELFTLAGGYILKWMMDGARLFLDRKMTLLETESMKEARNDFRENSDVLYCFIRDMCDRVPGGIVKSSDLRDAYAAYCYETDNPDMASKTALLKDRLRKMRVFARHSETGTVYQGIELKTRQTIKNSSEPGNADDMRLSGTSN